METRVTITIRYSLALAGGLALLAAPIALAQERPVQAAKDPVTKADIRVYKTVGGMRLEIDGADVRIRKELDGKTVRTSFETTDDALTIAQSPDQLLVVARGGRATVTNGRTSDADRARRLVGESPAALAAADLIGRIGLGPDSPLRPVLLTTRAMILDARGDPRGTGELVAWMKRPKQPRVIKTAQERTPTECWEAYEKEVFEAWEQQANCLENVQWWNPLGNTGCAIMFDLRVIGAMAWYLNCVKLLGFITG
jgi:hypothetical protein